jgi:polar amino acid transport system substrate-binding protein
MARRVLSVAALAWLHCSGVGAVELTFISPESPPWASVDPATGRNQGVFPGIVAELERRGGYRIIQSYLPFGRLEREMEVGSSDCGIFIWNDTRAAIARRGETAYDLPAGVVARKGVALAGYDDLRPLTISVLRRLAIEPRFDGDQGLRKDFDNDYRQGLQKVAHGRVDAIAGVIPTIRYAARGEGLDGYLDQELVLGTISLALQCSLKSPRLDELPELNRLIRDMREDGTLGRLFRQHYP